MKTVLVILCSTFLLPLKAQPPTFQWESRDGVTGCEFEMDASNLSSGLYRRQIISNRHYAPLTKY